MAPFRHELVRRVERQLIAALTDGRSPTAATAAAAPSLLEAWTRLRGHEMAAVLLMAAWRARKLELPDASTPGGWHAATLIQHAHRRDGEPAPVRRLLEDGLPIQPVPDRLTLDAAAILTAAYRQESGLWKPPADPYLHHPAYAWSPPAGTGHTRTVPPGLAAVRTPLNITLGPVLDGPQATPHLHTGIGRYWLVPDTLPHRPPWWNWERLSPYLTVGHGLALPIPHTDQTAGPGPHWALPDQWTGRWVADPAWLITALTTATQALGPPADRCCVCGDAVWPGDPRVTTSTPPGQAHRECASVPAQKGAR
ncbi:hypothetical protein [Streptomyces cacaoi]|uniref:hypothetical protein n=1 Tax=Streptomyces cacaoi TaxID=1898 RepID=UPI0011F21601|nr:hypothetical protein [Streptomyces cacaoi]